MTISTTTSRAVYAGNGVTTIFSFPYRFLANGDLEVTVFDAAGIPSLKTLTTDYTVSGADADAGGSVTMLVAPAVGESLVILRAVDLTQETDYNSGDAFPAETHERALDKLTMIDQQMQEQINRTIRIPLDDNTFDGQLPAIVPGRFLRVNDSGTALELVSVVETGELVVTPFIETLLDDTTAAAARTTLGAQVAGSYATSGANSNITSLSGLTTPLSLAQGGVGVTTAFAIRSLIGADRGIQPITATVASNALTLTLNPTILDFRSGGALASGDVSTRTVPTAITLTVSSGSTLGSSNGVLSRLAVLAMDNAGTVELAVVNLLGGVNLDELGLISTSAEGGAGGADSASTVYSATARSFLPYRIVGFVETTQATAGTWATAPSRVNGSGAALATWLAGYGQTSQGLTGSRALNTTYTNTTGRPIEVDVSAFGNASTDLYIQLLIDGSQRARSTVSYQEAGVWRFIYNTLSFTVHPGETYRVDTVGGSVTLTLWSERR